MINREAFYKALSGPPFFGLAHGHQKEGADAILTTWQSKHPNGDNRWLAYMLATAWHETAHTLQPVEEYGHGKGQPYGVPNAHTGHAYYGRGYVQLTWIANYAKMSTVTGVDLVHSPERALEPVVAADIMFAGMERGLFTGRKLSDYFNERNTDWVNARRIINGLDDANEIAGYAKAFYRALSGSDVPAPMTH